MAKPPHFTFGMTTIFTDAVFKEEEDRLKKIGLSLAQQNAITGPGISEFGWSCDGRVMVFDARGTRTLRKNRSVIHLSLRGEARELIQKFDKLEQDERLVSNIMGTLITRCKTYQDVRDALPDSLVNDRKVREDIPQLVKLSRSRPAAFMLQDDSKKLKQYEDMEKIIFSYLVNKLVL